MCLGVSLVVRAAHIMDGVTVLHQLAHVNSRGLLSLTAAWGLWEEKRGLGAQFSSKEYIMGVVLSMQSHIK